MAICNECNCEFEKRVGNQKSCSEKCAKIAYNKRAKRNKHKIIKKSKCIFCFKEFEYFFRKDRGERHFCNRSCASKFYIKNGAFDSWRLRANPKTGYFEKCLNPNCNNQVYLTQRFKKNGKGRVCSFECEKNYFSILFLGAKNPMFGKHLTDKQKEKQLQTLQKNHPNVKNAFMLAKHRTKSKPQVEIFEFLKEVFHDYEFEIEKRVLTSSSKELFADIISFKKKLIIEFNGDYWHCNPKKYEKTHFHAVKKMFASEIWRLDEERKTFLTKSGFNVVIIWESEYNEGIWKQKLLTLIGEYEKENNFDVKRSSVNNYSSADVKLGELLGSHGKSTTT